MGRGPGISTPRNRSPGKSPKRDDQLAGASIKRVLSILKPFRRNSAPQARVPSELWRIDLGPVAEPMMNGHTERMNFVVTERIALGKSAKRVTAQPIGRATERDFDWKSVQSPDRWRDATEDRDRKVNGSGFSPASGLRESESKRPAHPLERVFGREARREALGESALESLRKVWPTIGGAATKVPAVATTGWPSGPRPKRISPSTM